MTDHEEQMTLVETAKSLLMKHRHMTEPQAHRYLQRQAMNRRLPKRTVAMQVIQRYSKHLRIKAS